MLTDFLMIFYDQSPAYLIDFLRLTCFLVLMSPHFQNSACLPIGLIDRHRNLALLGSDL